MSVLGDEAVGELVHVQRAHQDRPGGGQALDQDCVMGGRRGVATDLRASQGRQALDVEQVLHREGHAGQRTGDVARIDRVRGGQGALGGDGREGVDAAIQAGNARQCGFGHGPGGDAAGADLAGDLDDAAEAHGSNASGSSPA